MTGFLRTAPTRRLIAVLLGFLAAVAVGSAIAVAAQGSGPKPPAKPLAAAVRQALAAKPVRALSARITFTNHLIDASNLQGTDPLLQGASGRLWISGHQLRLELQSNNGDAQILIANGNFSIYDPTSNTVYRGALPASLQSRAPHENANALPSIGQIQRDLNQIVRHAAVSGAIPSNVAGQEAYTVRVSPRHDGGLLGAAEVAWDAVRGVPLRFAIYARGDSSPVLELKATDISYGSVSPSVFSVSLPASAKVVQVAPGKGAGAQRVKSGTARRDRPQASGVAAVAARVPFKLIAPAKLVGLPRHSVTLLDWGGHPAALVTYGRYLGAVAVIEQAASAGSGKIAANASGDHQGFSLPTVSINGATGQELDTALGTVIRFTRSGVAYTVLGSVPASAAELAARGL